MLKERFDVTASSLGSYFGVGFNSPEQQLAYDLGLEENVVDEASQDRMDLGIYLEDSVLNYFENKLKISITDRNDNLLYAFDKRLKCKVDGLSVYNGEPVVIECKVSNSQSKKFTEDKGYYLQVQAYMEATGYNKAILLGLYQGKPTYRVIERDDKVIELIKEVVDFLYACFNGLSDPSEFPYDVTALYNEQPVIEDVEFTNDDAGLMSELNELRISSKEHNERINELEGYFKSKFENVKYETNDYVAVISTAKRAGGLDIDLVKEDYPDLDESKYKKPDSQYTTLRITKKKPK